MHFRRHLEQFCRLVQSACLMHEAAHDGAPQGKSAVVSLFVLMHLAPGYRPDGDPEWGARIDDALAGDADAALSR